jgi:hypothetical protein
VKVGEPSSQPEETIAKYIKSVRVRKDKLKSTTKRLRRWAFVFEQKIMLDNTFETDS